MAENRQQADTPASRDISSRAVLLGGAAIAGGVLLAALASYLLWRAWDSPAAGPNARQLPAIAQPTLQSAPQPDRERYFAEKQRLLASYQWIDESAGIARIPLEQAMQLMAAGAGNSRARPEKQPNVQPERHPGKEER